MSTMINIDNVSYGDCYHDGLAVVWQDVLHNGECFAALYQKQGSILKPIEMHYQKLVPESEAPKLDDWYISEDEGYIFAVFPELEQLVEYINNSDDERVKAAKIRIV